MELILLSALLAVTAFSMIKIVDILKDISESLRMLANNPKTIEEAKKTRLQTNKKD